MSPGRTAKPGGHHNRTTQETQSANRTKGDIPLSHRLYPKSISVEMQAIASLHFWWGLLGQKDW